MIVPAVDLVTYVGHYLVARMLYDELVRPLVRGDIAIALLLAAGAGSGYLLGRRSRRRSGWRA